MEERKYDLKSLYLSFESDEFQNDLKQIEEKISEINEYVNNNLSNYDNFEKKLMDLLDFQQEFRKLTGRCRAFIMLTMSADTDNNEANKYNAKLQMMLSNATVPFTKIRKYIGNYEKLDEIMKKDAYSEFEFYLTEIKRSTEHLLSDEQEEIISKMQQTGSSTWSQLQSLLTSKLEVDVTIKGVTKTMPVTQVGVLLRDKDAEVRKAAYLGLQKAYSKIEDSIAMSLSSIKGEVNYTSKLRGYESALHESLDKSRTKKETLDVMIKAMREYLPHFHKYLRRKAKVLGYENGLPGYEMGAPLGTTSSKFSIEEAEEFIIKQFKTFSEPLADLGKKAFKENWIDVYPRKGKRGGAFCLNIPAVKESRILTNFNGNLKDVVTLAHELGHAYHGEHIFKNNILNSSYPMPVAETASTFNETIVMNAVLNDSTDEEKLTLIDNVLQGHSMIIVGILARFMFEKEVFERRLDHPLNSKELQNIMRESLKEAYGDALDDNYINPFSWINTPHYYRPGLSFYNWPYAFGLLFAKGLYSQYLNDKDAFLDNYDNLLKATGNMNVEDVAKQANIDVTDINFWRSSLEILKKDIDLFLELTE